MVPARSLPGILSYADRRLCWIIALLLLTRAPALFHRDAIDDEQVYSVVGREMLHGGLPYLSAVERKPPLLFLVYATVFGATGANRWLALHVVALGWTLATMAVLYVIARRLFDHSTGLMAASLYGLYQMWADYRNLALNGELLMNLPIVIALALTLGPDRRRWRPELLLAGGLIALACLLKQPAGIAGVPLGLYVLGAGYRRSRGLEWGDGLWHAAELLLGFVAVMGATGALLAHLGILRETIYWSLTAHRDPIGPSTWHFWSRALGNTGFFLLESFPLCLGAVLAFQPASPGCPSRWQHREPERAALAGLLIVSILALSSSGQFLFHYYLQLLPPLCLLAAPTLTAGLFATPAFPRLSRRVLAGWLVATLFLFALVDTIGLARLGTDTAAGTWVRNHSSPSDRLYVWGQGTRSTGMYLDADLRPASRFIQPFPLTGHVFGGYPSAWGSAYEDARVLPGAWDTLMADFAAHPPRFIIDVEGIRPESRYPMRRYPRLDAYVEKGYRAVARTADGLVYQQVDSAAWVPKGG